jgi:hypothetical protein
MVISLRYLGKAGKVSVEVMPLYVSNAKGYKYWKHVLKKKVSLSMKVVTLVPLKEICSSQVRILLNNLWKKRIVSQ